MFISRMWTRKVQTSEYFFISKANSLYKHLQLLVLLGKKYGDTLGIYLNIFYKQWNDHTWKKKCKWQSVNTTWIYLISTICFEKWMVSVCPKFCPELLIHTVCCFRRRKREITSSGWRIRRTWKRQIL